MLNSPVGILYVPLSWGLRTYSFSTGFLQEHKLLYSCLILYTIPVVILNSPVGILYVHP